MSTGPLSDTFPGNLAGAAALWRPRQRGSRWSQDGWGLGHLQELSLLQQGKFLSELAWAFQWDFFLSVCLLLYSLNIHRAHLHYSHGRALASLEGSRFASSVRTLLLEYSTSLGAIAPAASYLPDLP